MSGFINTSSGGGGGSPTGPAGGDLGGTYPNPSVLGINGVVISGTPSLGNIIIASSPTAASWSAAPSGFTAGGDLSGTSTNQNVINIHGASVPIAGSLVTGNVLQVSGASALSYGAINLAGGANFVTGTLPVGNQAAQTLTGDVVGNTGANTLTLAGDVTGRAGVTVVGKIQGNTFTAGAPTKGQFVVATTASNYGPVTLSGDITESATTAGALTVVNINGTSVPATPSTNQVLVASSGTTATWATIVNSNISATAAVAVSKLAAGTSAQVLLNNATPTPTWTTFSGDATIGATGAVAVVNIHGASVPVSGALTTGNVLQVNGVSALTYAAVNLAGGANFVTGVLPAANQASQTLAGDVTGTTAASVVSAISGSTPINITPASLSWLNNILNPTITQATPTTDVATSDFNITPQAPFAGATVHLIGGNVNINLASPVSGSGENVFLIKRGGLIGISMGRFRQVSPTLWQLSFGTNARNPNLTNFALLADDAGTFTQVNATTSINLRIGAAATDPLGLYSGAAQFFGASGTSSVGGGVNVIGITNASTVPTSLPAGGLAIYADAGALETTGTGFQFHRLVSAPTITQVAPTTDVATQALNITAQAPYASAVTNVIPGNINLNFSAPVSGTAEAFVNVVRGGNTICAIGKYPGGANASGIWCNGNTGSSFTPSTTNYLFLQSGAQSIFNGPTSYDITIGNTTSSMYGAAAGVTFFGTGSSSISGGGTGVIGIHNAGTNPTTNPSAGVILYSELTTGHLKNRGSLGAVTTLGPAGSSGTITTQQQVYDVQFGTVTTTSSATPTNIFTYSTTSGKGGRMTIVLTSRATSTGTGIAIGDVIAATYTVTFSNVGGTVSIASTSPNLNGATAEISPAGSSITSILTATVATNVITLEVTNTVLATVDSQIVASIVGC